jgi:endonuclease/exonuclease/phosphatase family metal-dependent hydrolase
MRPEKRKPFLRRFFSFLFRNLVLLLFLLLLITISGKYIPPGISVIPAYLGLIFPYLFLVCLILFIIAVIKKYRFLIITGAVPVIWALFLMSSYVQMGIFNSKPPSERTFKVMTFNVRVFNLYLWKKNAELRDQIMNFIEEANPDVICFQEYYENTNGDFETFSILVNDLGYAYHHRYFPVILNKFQRFGIATFSKFPITGKKQINFDGSSNMTLQSDIEVDSGVVVRVFNNHLESIRLSGEDINFVSEVNLAEKEIERGKGILSRLRRAYRERQSQSDLIAGEVKESPYPVLVCGDFNDVPVSYSYTTISRGLKDAFVESGRGGGSTYPSKLYSFRIDYILYSPSLSSYKTTIHKNELSDHYAVSAIIGY